MMTSQKVSAPARAVAGDPASAPLVINLCSSNTPMSLVKPTAPELTRFTFFVSRRREEGRERFRLHMGYFQTRAEAERLLVVVRDVYPAAWIGAAPGQRLAANANAAHAAALPSFAATTSAGAPRVANAPVATQPAAVASGNAARSVAPRPVAAPPQRSNVGEVIAQLGSTASKPAEPLRPRPSEVAVKAPAAQANIPTLAPVPATANTSLATAAKAAPQAPAALPSLTDSQVLRVLEDPSGRPASRSEHRDIPVRRPEDTLTWQQIRAEVESDQSVSFALQLYWSPTPVDPSTIPALAIFEAYTLYAIEIARPDHKLYGLRLGFFSDAMSARQVAAYVRSEFVSVSVVPITVGERDRAHSVGGIQLLSRATPNSAHPSEEITLIDELTPARLRPGMIAGSAHSSANAVPVSLQTSAPVMKAAAKKSRGSRPRGSPRTLEETLEILGASQLSIDDGKGEGINMQSRGKRAPDKRTSTFSKLLDRLSIGLK